MNTDFIRNLQNKRCDYNHPDQATSQANSLILLSSGIYTEEERFVFELLQNAVDAHSIPSEVLNIRMVIERDYFIFMHNGDPFTERDIEGLCDVGNGNKMQDVKKIGYKGIGFKSVFMRSNNVIVESGEYCFKFDKLYWEDYWERNWDTEKYGEKDSDKKYQMPWQIIPIEAQPPKLIDTSGYNVVTYIKVGDVHTLNAKITKLLFNSQFLLFLKSKNIRMDFIVNGYTQSWISKSEKDNQITLSINGNEESRWLIYTNDRVDVPADLKESINSDINTPDKLKDAKTFDLSFAIALDNNGRIRPLTKEESVIYTYLPTSYRFGTVGFPFLVNANFITDAGRQQLHKDSEWNKLIFSKIPFEYLNWMKELSTTHKNYWEVLPEKSYGKGNPLEIIYADSMESAIKKIAFIPSLQDVRSKVLASESFMDRMGISDAISVDALIGHINRVYSCKFDAANQVSNIWKGSRILADYGVFIFDKLKLKKLFDDELAFENISSEFDVKLINYLYEYYLQNTAEQSELLFILKSTNFLLGEDDTLCTPEELFFPSSYKENNEFAEKAKLLHQDIYEPISSSPQIIEWLSLLGMEHLSDVTFIQNVICKTDYVTTENAIEVGKFLFKVNQRENIFDKISQYYLRCIPFLTSKGNLRSARELFLSSKYKPELDIEYLLDEDIFISDSYCENESISEWKVFLLKMGIREDILNENEDLYFYDRKYRQRYDIGFFEDIKKCSEKYEWISGGGWNLGTGRGYTFNCVRVNYGTFSFLEYCNNHAFSKVVLSKLMQKYEPDAIDTSVKCVSGWTGIFSREIYSSMLTDLGCSINHFKWVIENCSVFPTVKKDCRKAIEVYSNSIPNIKEIAGNYLPIIDIDEEISHLWQAYFGLKDHLTIEDYLFLLTEISADSEQASNNRHRISFIYQKLIELGCLESEKYINQIKEWAASNLLLSNDSVFISPSELSYVSLDGFSSKNRVYIGNPADKEKVIELLALMGVKIITPESIKTEFEEKEESHELKNILRVKISALALLASGEFADESLYRINKSKMISLIEQTHFYHCKKIKLTYGDATDVLEKNTFGNENEFYYIGNLRPANVEPLLTPLCKYLGVNKKERELFILFIENMEGIRQNLKDKGYENVSLLEDESIEESGTIRTSLVDNRTQSQYERDLITGFKGEIIVCEKLIAMGYQPECPSISTQDDYTHEIVVNGKTYFCKQNYGRYDISFLNKNGVKMYLEVKSTTSSKEYQENLPFSYRELSMIEECNNSDEKSYLIVRVFGVDRPEQDIYVFSGSLLKDNFKVKNSSL